MRITVFAFAFCSLTLPVFGQAAEQNPTQNSNAFNREFTAQRFAIVGKRSTIGTYYSLKPDCAPVDWFDMTITKPPENARRVLSI
jgi:hypothetical protein